MWHLEEGIWCKVLKCVVELCPVCLFEVELLADRVDNCVLQCGGCKVKTNNLMIRSYYCLLINCPAGDGLCCCGRCKGEVKDGGACSISVVVGGGVLLLLLLYCMRRMQPIGYGVAIYIWGLKPFVILLTLQFLIQHSVEVLLLFSSDSSCYLPRIVLSAAYK